MREYRQPIEKFKKVILDPILAVSLRKSVNFFLPFEEKIPHFFSCVNWFYEFFADFIGQFYGGEFKICKKSGNTLIIKKSQYLELTGSIF